MKYPNVLGVVHAKSTSSRIPSKNALNFFGEPLFLTALKKLSAIGISDVFLDSDSEEFIRIAQLNGFLVSKRPERESNNSVDGNQLISNFLQREKLFSEYVAQLSCTMPFVSTETLQVVLENTLVSGVSGFLGTIEKNYSWEFSALNSLMPKYDLAAIPNSIDLVDQINEVTGFYVVKLEQESNRIVRVPSPSTLYITDVYETFDLNFLPDYEFSRLIESGLKAHNKSELPSGLTGERLIYQHSEEKG
jgi:CMP-N-acetylneuraminic acid synthetase